MQWGYSWDEYQGMDSWRSTPASEEEAMEGRRKLWAHMEKHGKQLGFEGLRISKDGRLFTIKVGCSTSPPACHHA